ncbi:hypothetical protein VE02_08156 [Pseudogymnoascus sp. 03VT05]|nr:hypothetical protein VE02_08156 [Pseudogymnoascus sp. 03VT05]
MSGLESDGGARDAASAQQKFPNDPIFTRLRQLSLEIPGVLFHDEHGIDASYNDLVSDVMHLRQVLREQLPNTSFNEQGFLQNNAVSIAFLAFSGYYFIVSFLAIVALGGVYVPLATGLTPEEALYYLNKTKATYILVEASTFDKAITVRDYFQNEAGQELNLIPITRAKLESNPCFPGLEINEELNLSPTIGCLVLFTSGTTGLPKGVLLPRQLFYSTGDEAPPPEALYLASCPVHWVGGTGLIECILSGVRLHTMKSEPRPSRFWEDLREGKVTEMSVSPTLLRELMEYCNENITDLPSEDRDKYINGTKNLQRVYTSGSVLNPSTRQLFKNLTNVPITNAYGITEMGGGVTITPDSSALEEGHIGTPLPGTTIKLSDGDRGEILVKGSNMFIKYIDDEAATRAAFDDEGFYKTGDNAHRIGDDYYFDGRVSCDYDQANPQNWSTKKKVFVAFEICLYTFTIYIGSAIYVPSMEGVMKEFGVSEIVASLGLALYVISYGLGALLWSPLSEIPILGRTSIYIVTFFIFVILIPTALVQNIGGLLVLRFLLGWFGSPCLATGAAGFSDMFTFLKLPYCLDFWAASGTMAPAMGPIVAGFSVLVKG